MLKDIYWAREQFHYILDNGKQVEMVVQETEQWIQSMTKEIRSVFDPFIKNLNNTKTYIANYVKNSLFNAIIKGLNNLIRSVRRAAFGMTKFEHLRWRAVAISD
jgi:transposase